MKVLVKNLKIFWLLTFCFFISEEINANLKKKMNVFFHGGYTFESFVGQKNAAVYISVFNHTDKEIFISSVSSDISKISEIHEIKKDGNIMKMSKVKKLSIKPNDTFFFQPGGSHIMLMNLKKELKDGEEFIIKFFLENSEIIEANIKVLNSNLRNSRDGI